LNGHETTFFLKKAKGNFFQFKSVKYLLFFSFFLLLPAEIPETVMLFAKFSPHGAALRTIDGNKDNKIIVDNIFCNEKIMNFSDRRRHDVSRSGKKKKSFFKTKKDKLEE
jgi:hypothetical protein